MKILKNFVICLSFYMINAISIEQGLLVVSVKNIKTHGSESCSQVK